MVVKAGPLSRAMGWQLGDRLTEINGYPLRSLDEVLTAYLALASETDFALDIERDGVLLTLDYEVR